MENQDLANEVLSDQEKRYQEKVLTYMKAYLAFESALSDVVMAESDRSIHEKATLYHQAEETIRSHPFHQEMETLVDEVLGIE